MTDHKRTVHRLLAGAGIAALSALMVVGTGGVASATPTAPVSTIDPSATATLTITKYLQPSTPGSEANGTPQTVTGTPIEGVTFAAQRVPGIDLTTNLGWIDAAKETVSGAQNAVGVPTTSEELQTTAKGIAQFSSLKLGLYLVTETNFPSNVTPSAPFLVTLPMTDPTNLNDWMYDVYVYPKNAETSAKKSVNDASAVKLGDSVVYTIDGQVPESDNVDGYQITDQLDPKLNFVSATVGLVDSTGAALTSPTLVDVSDYTISPTAAAPGPLVTVSLTSHGLAKLDNLWLTQAGAQVQVVIKTTVNASGVISNTADLFPSANAITTNTGVPTLPVVTEWGGITILKQDATTQKALPGAVFQVYVTNSSSTPPVLTGSSPAKPITIGKASSWTTGSDGTVKIDGLRYSDWANNAKVADGTTGYNEYWLVETNAPSGYELLAQPVPFTVEGQATDAASLQTVTDVPHNGGQTLPLTGGSGTAAFTVGGVILLVLAGGGYLVAARRRRAEG